MHDPVPERLAAQVSILVGSEGWPLIPWLLADSEEANLRVIRSAPLSPEAKAAAVKLAHIEELRTLFRSVATHLDKDPFDVAERPDPAWYGQGPGREPEPDDYEL